MKQPPPIEACIQCKHWYTELRMSGNRYAICGSEDRQLPDTGLIPTWCPLEDAPTDAFVCSRCGVEYDPLEDAVNPVNDLATDARIDALLKEPKP